MKSIGTLATLILFQLSFTGTAFSGNEGGNGPNDGIKELKQEFAATAEFVQQTINENPVLSHLLVSQKSTPSTFGQPSKVKMPSSSSSLTLKIIQRPTPSCSIIMNGPSSL